MSKWGPPWRLGARKRDSQATSIPFFSKRGARLSPFRQGTKRTSARLLHFGSVPLLVPLADPLRASSVVLRCTDGVAPTSGKRETCCARVIPDALKQKRAERFQGLVPARVSGFESPLRHHL